MLVVILALVGPALHPAHGLAGGDWTDLLYPFRRFAMDTFAASGRLPLWNPSIYGGMPHLASLNALALYPTEVAALAVPAEASVFYAVDVSCHLLLAAAGLWWWLRRRGMPPEAAAAGALAYALGGHLLTLPAAGHPHWVRGLAWLPWMFAGAEAATLAGAAAAGAALGAVILGAALHFVALALPVLTVRVLGAGGTPGQRLARLAAFAAAAGTVGAVIWIPGLEYYAHSIRRGADRAFTAGWSLTPWDLVALLLPEIWGDVTAWWGPHPFRSSSDYPGLIALGLAGAAVAGAPRASVGWLVLIGASGVLALGPATPLGALVAGLPGYGGLRAPLRWLSFAHIGLAVLMAAGVSGLLLPHRDNVRARRALRAAAAACALLSLACLAAGRGAGPADRVLALPFVAAHVREGRVAEPVVREGVDSAFRAGAIRGGVAAAALGLVSAFPHAAVVAASLVVLAADLGTAARPWYQYGDDRELRRPDAVASWLLEHGRRPGEPPARVATDEYFGLPNRRMGLGLEFTSGYHGLPLRRYADVQELALRTGSLAVLSALNAGWIVAVLPPAPGWTPAAKLTGTAGEPVWILPHPAPWPRAWAAWPRPVADLAGAVALMREPDWTARVAPLEGRAPAGWRPRAPGGGAPHGRIALTRGVDALVAEVELDGDALVVFSETWYPAWRVTVDGIRAPLLVACGTLRGLALGAGSHAVDMRYGGWAITIGVWLTCLGFALLAALALRGGAR